MRFPRIRHYANCQLTNSIFCDEISAGDTVYYISPASEYAIKKSKVIAKTVIKPSHHFGFIRSVELTLDNGDVANADDTFPTKEAALDFLISDLEARIRNDRNALLTLQKEIDYKERMLQLMKEKVGSWTTA